MSEEKKNIAASVRAKLYNWAKNQGMDFSRVLLLYMQERILCRISLSEYHHDFILKGGLLFYVTHGQAARPTKDLDFWIKHKSNKSEFVLPMFIEIFSIQTPDGLTFDLENLIMESIKSEEKYEGLRLKIPVRLEQARLIVQLDLGFDDIVFPEPVTFSYPAMLSDNAFNVFAYSWESVIAEKFEAMVKLGDANSRMKDIFDIHFLLSHHSFQQKELQGAIAHTFKHRKTTINRETMFIFTIYKQNSTKRIQWQAFLRKSSLDINTSFENVLGEIETFLKPVIDGIMFEIELTHAWNPSTKRWE